VTPGSRMGSVLVQCSPLGPGRTRVDVTYVLTGLTEAGNGTLRDFGAGYEAFIDEWRVAIRASMLARNQQ
jgi:hypothetical protein